jgi:prepilin-type N-terminal cleavage/methylation domain-containing protein
MTRSREGFTLIETIVALTMFAIVMLGMARMAAAVAVKGRTNDLTAKRNAALQQEANKFGAVPFNSLAAWPTANKTLSRGTFTYTRRLAITSVSPTRYTVKIVVTPASDPTKKDSVVIDRTRPPTGSPLCTGC